MCETQVCYVLTIKGTVSMYVVQMASDQSCLGQDLTSLLSTSARQQAFSTSIILQLLTLTCSAVDSVLRGLTCPDHHM